MVRKLYSKLIECFGVLVVQGSFRQYKIDEGTIPILSIHIMLVNANPVYVVRIG
jgi:hypothetical protein